MIIFIILWLKLCSASELWASGVILNKKTTGDSTLPKSAGMFGTILQPIFGAVHEEEECDNFVQVTLPVNQRFKRILFVTPGIAKANPEGVKETFFRLYCNLIGILLRGRELIKFARGTFFALKPSESRFVLKSCLNEFERNFGIKLLTAMIDSGPDELTFSLQQEFSNRGIELFRHPANMLNGEIYYLIPIQKRNELGTRTESKLEAKLETKSEEYSWQRDPLLKGQFIFKILERYSPIIPDLPGIPEKMPEEQKLNVPDTKEIIEALEKVYGPLEEISLEDAVENVETFENDYESTFYLSTLFPEEQEIDNHNDDEEYEIIKPEDFKYYWQPR